jgi:hypothetical protein
VSGRFRRGLPAAALLCFSAASPAHAAPEAPEEISLETVRAFDPRLPMPDDADLKQIEAETNRILRMKLNTNVSFRFRSHGAQPLDRFFASVPYRTPAFAEYAAANQFRLDERPPFERERERIVSFLKQWELKDLAGFFPEYRLASYEEFFALLVPTYIHKVESLKRIRLKSGEPLLVPEAPPYQSYVHWEALMNAQKGYDLVLTNTLIVYDKFTRPYPHTVCKHAKVGGGAFESPARRALNGHSMLVNFLEDSGAVPELSGDVKDLPRAERNKIVAGFLFAHELGHAFFHIPDVYDHGDACLMNSSFENLSHKKGYDLLVSERAPCKACRPYVEAKEQVLAAEKALARRDPAAAGAHFEKAAETTPFWLDTDLATYLMDLYDRAWAAYQATGDDHAAERVRKRAASIKSALKSSQDPRLER